MIRDITHSLLQAWYLKTRHTIIIIIFNKKSTAFRIDFLLKAKVNNDCVTVDDASCRNKTVSI